LTYCYKYDIMFSAIEFMQEVKEET
jgi:hypothetical protein